MKTPRKPGEKTRGRPFQPGNPGKPKGARSRVTRAVEVLLEGQHEQLTQTAIEKALEGDTTALRLCLERLAPVRKDAPIVVELPAVRSPADTVAASSALLSAVAGGEITPDEAGRVMALLTAHRGIIETNELAERIAALESASMPVIRRRKP